MYPTPKKKKISEITQTQPQTQVEIVCEEDRISNLPDEILIHILSLLEMKEAVRSSILSNRWRYLWTWNPSLDFSYCKPEVIDRCLDLHKAPKLRSFKVYYSTTSTAGAEALNRWLRYSATHSVEELFLSRSNYCMDCPVSLFECQTLMQLTLRYGKLSLSANFCGFKSLVTLCLEQVFIKGEELCTLISMCDLLENLKVIHCIFVGKRHKISATNSSRLRNLKIISYLNHRSTDTLEINAPSLLSFTCSGSTLSLSDFPHLYEADLSFIGWNEDLEGWRRILSAITCVRTLSAGAWLFQKPKCRKHLPVPFHHSEFKYLKELNVHMYDKASKDYLASFISLLKACPALETVCLHLPSGFERDRCIRYDKVMSWLRQIHDPVFSHDRLKTLKVVGFRGTKIELLVLKFLLEKTIALESLILSLPHKIFKSKSELLKNELTLHKMNSTSIKILHMLRY